jgi:RimJ/RimL family protein N-acetyltransferase
MDIKIQLIDINDDHQLNSLLSWENDLTLRHLIIPRRSEEEKNIRTLSEYKKDLLDNPEYARGHFVIFIDSALVGCLSIQMNPQHIKNKKENTAWLSLTIGEKKFWGKGVAQKAMEFFEEESSRRGATRAELGTFEFNHRAINFYQKLGYKEIYRLPKFTFWDGQFWDDIRMEKMITQK